MGINQMSLMRVLKNLAATADKMTDAAENGLVETAQRAMAVSKRGGEGYSGNIVPVATSALTGSGHVGDPHRTPGMITIRLGYGGPTVDYALTVHETMGRRYRRPGSGAAYLRGPVNHMGSKMPAIVGKHVKKAL